MRQSVYCQPPQTTHPIHHVAHGVTNDLPLLIESEGGGLGRLLDALCVPGIQKQGAKIPGSGEIPVLLWDYWEMIVRCCGLSWTLALEVACSKGWLYAAEFGCSQGAAQHSSSGSEQPEQPCTDRRSWKTAEKVHRSQHTLRDKGGS